jgi:hypothetical protein
VWLFLSILAVPDLASSGSAFFHLTHTAEFTAHYATRSSNGFTVTHGTVHDRTTGGSFDATVQDADPHPGDNVEVWVSPFDPEGNVYTGTTVRTGLAILITAGIIAAPPAGAAYWLLRTRRPDQPRHPPTNRRRSRQRRRDPSDRSATSRRRHAPGSRS